MKAGILALLIVFFAFNSNAQLRLDTLGWIPPVDIPIFLSGNFAELRSGHFHAGIDIKTQGKEGFNVYAVKEGYISRIKIAPDGYGKAIYISHPDGYTSVYGHLSELSIQLEKYVRAIQYTNKSYSVDIYPDVNEMKVAKGDIIGLSGNSGSSGGPHLHFEVRDSKNSIPLNGLFLGYDIKDNISPVLEYLYVYPQDDLSAVNNKNQKHYYSLKKLNGGFKLRQGDTLLVGGAVGFGLKGNEFLNGSNNPCGFYQLKAFINDTLFFQITFDGVSFDETRYINSLMDFEENVEKKRKLYKLFIDPNNNLSVYDIATNRGILDFRGKKGLQKIRIEAIDAYGNNSTLRFSVLPNNKFKPQLATKNKIVIPWQDSFAIDTLGLKLAFDKASFYDTLNMDFNVDTKRNGVNFAPVYQVHTNKVPIHKSFNIGIQVSNVPESLISKLQLGYWQKDKFVAAGGVFSQGYVSGKVRELGTYTLILDTISPLIIPLANVGVINDLSGRNNMSFNITDNNSIEGYNGYINDNWVLFEYDAKNDLITYNFDEYMPANGSVNFTLEVWDGFGNKSIFEREYELPASIDNNIGQ